MGTTTHTGQDQPDNTYPIRHRAFIVNLLKAHGPQTAEAVLDAAQQDNRHKPDVAEALQRMVKGRELIVQDPAPDRLVRYRLP